MPSTPLRPCPTAGCNELVNAGKCARHRLQYERDRGTSTSRGYGVRWRRFRLWYIAEVVALDPRCKDCERPFMAESAIELHHVFKAAAHPELLFDVGNIRALCHFCHSARTKRGE